MRNRIGAGALSAILLAALAASAAAVTFGEPDGDRHPHVGAIVLQSPSGYFSCSGTLLSPTVVLTAGHCTSEGGVPNLNTWVKFTPTISFDGLNNYPTINKYLDDRRNGWIKGEAIPHPLFNDFAEFPLTFDIGVVVLKQRVSSPVFGSLPSEGFLETIRGSENDFTVVGYGLQGLLSPFFGDTFERYQGKVRLVELNSTTDAGMSAKFTNNPGSGGGSCFGDSGGPVFHGSSTTVAAIVSFGFTPCIGVDYQFRIDTDIALSFLNQYVK
jgi:hypothetical protein